MVIVDPWSSNGIKDYEKIMKDLGVGRFEKFAKSLPKLPLSMKRGLVYGEKDFAKIADAVKKKKKFALLTGLMPSGEFHFGHMALAQQIIYYQKLGAEIYIVVADIESYLTRDISLEQAKKTAVDQYILNYIALGLKPKKCKIYFQSDFTNDYNNLVKTITNKTTLNEMKSIYGMLTPGKMISVFSQIADILCPQLKENGGKKPTIVPVGFDQLSHISLCRDIAAKMGFILPSATFHKFIIGLDGGKMSSSNPKSYISLTDSPKLAEQKIKKYAFSGGQETVEMHRKKGGNPDVDVSFQYLKYLFEPDDKKLAKIEKNYKSGKLLTGELKQILIKKICAFLKQHQANRTKAKKDLKKFLRN